MHPHDVIAELRKKGQASSRWDNAFLDHMGKIGAQERKQGKPVGKAKVR